MDFQQAQDRRAAHPFHPGDGRTAARKRAADARLRRAIREAFARQRSAEQPRVDVARLRVVRQQRP
jgi:hypothetical protein